MPLKQLLLSSSGRIPRSTYWLYSLAVFAIYIVLLLIDLIAGTFDAESEMGLFSTIFNFLLFIPGILVAIKRSHDREHSGWFVLLLFIPIINLWPGIELSFFAGTDGPNKYGPDPRKNKISIAADEPKIDKTTRDTYYGI